MQRMKQTALDVYTWFERRLQLEAPVKDAVLHKVPRQTASWWYVFGSAAFTLLFLQIFTGILLALVYVPSAGEAWKSLDVLNHEIPLGWFLRAMHGWGSNFMVAIVLIHMAQVFLFGAYKFPRELTWIIGVFLLLMTLGMAFTGQVLRFDQDAYWGLGIGASIASRVPWIGSDIVHLMLGGPIIAGATLSRFFALHVFVIPGTMLLFVFVHVWMVLKLGVNDWPMPGRVVERKTYVAEYHHLAQTDGIPFVPGAFWKDLIFSGAVLAAVAVCAVVFGPFGPGGGATGAIGEPLIAELLKQGHSVVGMTTSKTRAKILEGQGASPAIVNALDAKAVETALRQAAAEVVIDELTSLPKEQSDLPEYAAGDRRLRIEGGGNLLRAAIATGVRRYLQQSSGFFLKAAPGVLADESSPLDVNASPGVAASARTYAELEERLFSFSAIEGVALRYGFFYGPKTWYFRGGSAADTMARQQYPLVGEGQGMSSFVHINDAALATVAALTAEAGVYNVVDDDPSPQRVWLPAFANSVGAPPPPHVTEAEARARGGDDAVYYATKLSGASNAKAKRVLGWRPRRLEWLKAE